jgi:DnaJ family protein C protein 10
MEGKIKCGKVNCQEHQYLCQLAGIQAYPTIRFYPLAPQSGLVCILYDYLYFFL